MAGKSMTVYEARRLHEEAGAMTMAEMRRIGLVYGVAWRTNLDKGELTRAFRRWLSQWTDDSNPRGETDNGG